MEIKYKKRYNTLIKKLKGEISMQKNNKKLLNEQKRKQDILLKIIQLCGQLPKHLESQKAQFIKI